MKSAIRILRPLALAAAFLIPTSAATAAEDAPQHPAKPMLWKVEGKGLEKPSYLFGTIHLGDPVVSTLHPAAKEAFDGSSAFYAEVAMDTASQMAAMPELVRKDGKTLGGSIGEKLSASLDAELKRVNPSLDAAPFQQLKTFYVALALPLLEGQFKGEQPLDLQLWNAAEKAGKPVAGIQKVEDQLAGMNELSEAEQVELLGASLEAMETSRAEGKGIHEDLRAAYLTGDPLALRKVILEALADQTGSAALRDKLVKSLLTDRDVIMAEFVSTTLLGAPERSHFFAAGAGHFCTEVSVVSHLQKAGFTVTKIDN